MEENHYRVLRKTISDTTGTGNFLPASENNGPCNAFAISCPGALSGTFTVTTSHGVQHTLFVTNDERFKIFEISAVSWERTGIVSTDKVEIITLF